MSLNIKLLNNDTVYEISEACHEFGIRSKKSIIAVCNKEKVHEHYRVWRYEYDKITGHEFDFLEGLFYSPNTGKAFKDLKRFPNGVKIVQANKTSVLERYFYVYNLNGLLSVTGQFNLNAIRTRLNNCGYYGEIKFEKQFSYYEDAVAYKNNHQKMIEQIKKRKKQSKDNCFYVYQVMYIGDDIFTKHPEPRKKKLLSSNTPIYIDITNSKDVCLPSRVKKFTNVLDCRIEFSLPIENELDALHEMTKLIDKCKINNIDLLNDRNNRNLKTLISYFKQYYIVLIKDKQNNLLFILATSKEQIEHQYHIICKTKNFKDTHYDIVDVCYYNDIPKLKEKWRKIYEH